MDDSFRSAAPLHPLVRRHITTTRGPAGALLLPHLSNCEVGVGCD